MCDGLTIIKFKAFGGATPGAENLRAGRDYDSYRPAEGYCRTRSGRSYVPIRIIASLQVRSIGLIPQFSPGLVKNVPESSGARNCTKYRALSNPLTTRPTVALHGANWSARACGKPKYPEPKTVGKGGSAPETKRGYVNGAPGISKSIQKAALEWIEITVKKCAGDVEEALR